MAIEGEDPKDVTLALLLGWLPNNKVVRALYFLDRNWCRPTKPIEDPNFGSSNDPVWALDGIAYGALKDVLKYDLTSEVTT